MSKGVIEKAKAGIVATTFDAKEAAAAQELLMDVLKLQRWSRESLVKLTIPRGEESLQNTMVRFLRARGGDKKKAVEMINEAMHLRQKLGLDSILEQPLAKELTTHIQKGLFEGLLPEFDNFGRPVYMLRGGISNKALHELLKHPSGMERSGGKKWGLADLEDVWLHHHLIFMEWMTSKWFNEASKRSGKLINKYVVIDDLKGFNMFGVRGLFNVMSLFKKQAMIDSILYPELLDSLFFLNSPAVFRAPWNVIEGFIDPETAKKVFVVGKPSTWEPVLKVLFPKEKLPDFLGGSLEGNHVSTFNMPSTVMFDRIEDEIDAAGAKAAFPVSERSKKMKELYIPSRDKKTLTLHVEKAPCCISWQIGVLSHDIQVTIMFLSRTSKEIQLFQGKHTASECRMNMIFEAEEVGTLQIEMSNQHSRMRGKNIVYRIFSWDRSTGTSVPVTEEVERHTLKVPVEGENHPSTGTSVPAAEEVGNDASTGTFVPTAEEVERHTLEPPEERKNHAFYAHIEEDEAAKSPERKN